MSFIWGPLLLSALVSMAVAVTVVVLAGFALVGWSGRSRKPGAGAPRVGPGPVAGTAMAAICLLGIAAIVGYGLLLVVG